MDDREEFRMTREAYVALNFPGTLLCDGIVISAFLQVDVSVMFFCHVRVYICTWHCVVLFYRARCDSHPERSQSHPVHGEY